MVQLTIVDAVDDVLAWVSECLQHSDGVLIYAVGVEVLGDCAVVQV